MQETGNQNVHVIPLDVSSFISIRKFVAKMNDTEMKVDVLIHNAGYYNVFKRSQSIDGIEMTMTTNYYGPFLLTHLLFDLLMKSDHCRIIVVSSVMHKFGNFNPNSRRSLNPVDNLFIFHLYSVSKCANIWFTLELSRRLQGTTITVNALHPGVVDTGIWRNVPFPAMLIM
ncbi:unnamed protein product [Diamesa serratosioi]